MNRYINRNKINRKWIDKIIRTPEIKVMNSSTGKDVKFKAMDEYLRWI